MKEIEKILWNDRLSIGNSNLDKDHHKIIDIFNSLYDYITNGGQRDEFARILSELTDYSKLHFGREEEYMTQFSYPKLERHKKLHKDYIYKIAMYNFNLLGYNPPNPIEIIHFLKNWWEQHIMCSDHEYENYKMENKLSGDYRRI